MAIQFTGIKQITYLGYRESQEDETFKKEYLKSRRLPDAPIALYKDEYLGKGRDMFSALMSRMAGRQMGYHISRVNILDGADAKRFLEEIKEDLKNRHDFDLDRKLAALKQQKPPHFWNLGQKKAYLQAAQALCDRVQQIIDSDLDLSYRLGMACRKPRDLSGNPVQKLGVSTDF